jgi:hypothetical protein
VESLQSEKWRYSLSLTGKSPATHLFIMFRPAIEMDGFRKDRFLTGTVFITVWQRSTG